MTPEIKQRVEQLRHGNVPEGYKKSSAGIIPQTWITVSLGELGVAKNGLNFHRDDKGYLVRVLGVGDFKDKTVMFGMGSLTEVSLSSKPDDDSMLQNGDIVFVRSNGSKELVGRNLLVYPNNTLASYGGFCIRYRMNNFDLTTPEYLNFILDSGVLKRKLKKENQGSNISNLNQDILSALAVALPMDKGEQTEILRIMKLQDKVIELKEKLLAEKRCQKKYLMQQLLTGKKRLPGFDGAWKKVKLKEVLTERKEKNKKQNLRICSVAVQKGVVDQVEHLGRSYAAADTSNYGVASYGDIIYTKSPTGDFPYGIIKQSHMDEDVAISPLYGIYKPITYSLGYLLHTYFTSAINARNYLFPIVQKGAKNTINITNDTFVSNTLYLPLDEEEQRVLAEVYITADREIGLLQKDIEAEQQKKKALMQLLLTGIVRVKV